MSPRPQGADATARRLRDEHGLRVSRRVLEELLRVLSSPNDWHHLDG
jgi:hypothetical protein